MRLSKEGRWPEMAERITDEMLDVVGVSGTPAQVASRIVERNRFAGRTSMVLYNETDPEAVVDIVRGIRRASSA